MYTVQPPVCPFTSKPLTIDIIYKFAVKLILLIGIFEFYILEFSKSRRAVETREALKTLINRLLNNAGIRRKDASQSSQRISVHSNKLAHMSLVY